MPARGISPSACGRGAKCQLRPPAQSQRRVPLSAGAPALSVSGEEAQHVVPRPHVIVFFLGRLGWVEDGSLAVGLTSGLSATTLVSFVAWADGDSRLDWSPSSETGSFSACSRRQPSSQRACCPRSSKSPRTRSWRSRAATIPRSVQIGLIHDFCVRRSNRLRVWSLVRSLPLGRRSPSRVAHGAAACARRWRPWRRLSRAAAFAAAWRSAAASAAATRSRCARCVALGSLSSLRCVVGTLAYHTQQQVTTASSFHQISGNTPGATHTQPVLAAAA